MRFPALQFVLLALPTASIAVSLADFTPRVSNLPALCNAVYTQTINGCASTDWVQGKTGTGCSKKCVLALSSLTSEVKTACGNKGITGSNLIVAFLANKGPQSLCTNAAQYLPGTTSSSGSTQSSTTSTSSSTSTTSESSSSTTSTKTSMSTTTSLSSSSTDILVDTSTQPTTSSTTSSQGSSQTDMTNSGGGSPFDTGSNMVSAGAVITTTIMTALFTTTFAMLAHWR